ncbi:23460_t:CDS:2 [Gigaspora rosea]|nr:23460_t:CDS:2 [Gigaspora rosea]
MSSNILVFKKVIEPEPGTIEFSNQALLIPKQVLPNIPSYNNIVLEVPLGYICWKEYCCTNNQVFQTKFL